jgi:hypothetical protein
VTSARYAVGIDLGTTHCTLSFADLQNAESGSDVRVMPIPQLASPGAVEERVLFPSFLYIVHDEELSPADLTLPWGVQTGYVAGELARLRGSATPIRLVSSAKSWLCHPGVDRRTPILPPETAGEIRRISPLEASTRYLEHMRDAWNHTHREHPLAQQDVILTVPASFDPAARELTAEAARAAGIEQLVLVEEPQAAFYSWIQANGDAWRRHIKVGDVILVVDVGGGTTDLSLIAVSEAEGSLELRRVAVGEHILLGGDNMDLALAHVVRAKLERDGKRLDPWQLQAVTHGCRAAKEALLSDLNVPSIPVVVPSRGSKLIGRTLRMELTRDEVEETLIEGFFPIVDVSARPASRARAALTRIGLPYAQDPAVTRHLAAFLGRQASATGELEGFDPSVPTGGFLQPTAILFNGGVFKARPLAERVFNTINGWLAAAGKPAARLLEGADLDLAVSRGAAYYGFVRKGRGVRIRGGTARSFYVGVESAMPAVPGIEPPIQALCVAPFGMEEGTQAELPPQEFGLVVGEPVRFRFFGSSVRREDRVGALLESWATEEIEELEAIEATLPPDGRPAGEIVPVRLHARVTEVGTLQLEAVPRSGSERWAVEFNVRGSQES